MTRAVIALGSNLPPRRQNLEEAVRKLGALPGCAVRERSKLYETCPVGGPPQGMYLNAALVLDTLYSPSRLLRELLEIEKALGRTRTVKNGPRTLDLDIIFYDDLVLSEPGIEIPHPRFRKRGFVLFPLNDIISQFVDPGTGKTLAGLLKDWIQEGGEIVNPVGRL